MQAKITLTGTLQLGCGLPGREPYEKTYCIPEKMKSYLSLQTQTQKEGQVQAILQPHIVQCSLYSQSDGWSQIKHTRAHTLLTAFRTQRRMPGNASKQDDSAASPCQSIRHLGHMKTDKNFTLTIRKVF